MKTDMVSFASSGEFVPKLKKKKTESEESDVRNSKWSKWIFPCINIFIRTFAQLSNTNWSKRFRVFDLSQLSCVNFEKWYHRWKTVEVLVLSPVSSNMISTKWTRYQHLSKNRTQQPNDVRKITLDDDNKKETLWIDLDRSCYKDISLSLVLVLRKRITH